MTPMLLIQGSTYPTNIGHISWLRHTRDITNKLNETICIDCGTKKKVFDLPFFPFSSLEYILSFNLSSYRKMKQRKKKHTHLILSSFLQGEISTIQGVDKLQLQWVAQVVTGMSYKLRHLDLETWQPLGTRRVKRNRGVCKLIACL